MAHIAKYKAASCGHMLAHYRRDESSLGRENIDPTRTKDNYTLGLDDRDGKVGAMDGIEPNWATVEGRIEGVNKAAKAAGKRAVRKDAVVMADVVVTLPENVRKRTNLSFRLYLLVPDTEARQGEHDGRFRPQGRGAQGRFARSRSYARAVHADTRWALQLQEDVPALVLPDHARGAGDYLEKRMGYRPEVELGDETRAMRVYADKSADIDKVRGAVDRAVVQPAEEEAARIVADAQARADALVRDAETRRDELVAQVADGERRLSDVRMQVDEETDRLECLRQKSGQGCARRCGTGTHRCRCSQVRGCGTR